MKIIIVKHVQDKLNHIIELRIEQEEEPYQSLNPITKLKKSIAENLSQDELYSLAYNQVKNKTIEVFSRIKYTDEIDKPLNFNIINSKSYKIVINGPGTIDKEMKKEIEVLYSANLIDQYDEVISEVELAIDEKSGCSFNEKTLSISSDDITFVRLKSKYENIECSLDVKVITHEKVLSEVDILGKSVTDLMIENMKKR